MTEPVLNRLAKELGVDVDDSNKAKTLRAVSESLLLTRTTKSLVTVPVPKNSNLFSALNCRVFRLQLSNRYYRRKVSNLNK